MATAQGKARHGSGLPTTRAPLNGPAAPPIKNDTTTNANDYSRLVDPEVNE